MRRQTSGIAHLRVRTSSCVLVSCEGCTVVHGPSTSFRLLLAWPMRPSTDVRAASVMGERVGSRGGRRGRAERRPLSVEQVSAQPTRRRARKARRDFCGGLLWAPPALTLHARSRAVHRSGGDAAAVWAMSGRIWSGLELRVLQFTLLPSRAGSDDDSWVNSFDHPKGRGSRRGGPRSSRILCTQVRGVFRRPAL